MSPNVHAFERRNPFQAQPAFKSMIRSHRSTLFPWLFSGLAMLAFTVQAQSEALNRTRETPIAVIPATKDAPFVNSLGLEFVPVPGTKVLFCRMDTRVQDFRRYAESTNYRQTGGINVMKVKTNQDGSRSLPWELDENASWEQPGFAQSGDHPVVGVSWNEAREFCAWLSKQEGRTYRLPTDEEWSAAAGAGKYPWGNNWPPPNGSGNFGDKRHIESLPGKGWTSELPNYDDGYARTSPVGKFLANPFGLFDMGGNVRQWCEDEYRSSMNSVEILERYPALKSEKASDGTPCRVLRGSSWGRTDEISLRSASRGFNPPAERFGYAGFRCVLAIPGGQGR